MAGSQFQSQKLISGFLNQESFPGLGTPIAYTGISGSLVSQYLGWLGYDLYLTAKEAAALSDATNVGTLYEGIYAAVQLKSSFSLGGVDIGYPLFWSDRKNYIVTPDVTAANAGNLAGINILKNAKMTALNYIYIQKAGRATLRMGATLQKATPADGDLLVLDTSTSLFNDLTDTDTITAGGTGANATGFKLVVGVSNNGGVAPAGSALVIANLFRNFDNNW